MRKQLITISLFVVLLVTCILYLTVSREAVGLPSDEIGWTIFLDIRLPRLLLALCAGFILSYTGLVFQTIFNNNLADSFSLGLASGAGFGSALALVSGFSAFAGGIVFSLLTLVIVMLLTEFNFKGDRRYGMVLSGMFINFFFSSALYGLTVIWPQKAQLIMAYLFGTVGGAEWQDLFLLLPAAVICIIIIFSSARPLAILASGESVAKGVGVPTTFYLYTLLIISSILTAVLISETGIIGFVGLIIPQLFKRHKVSLPMKLFWTGMAGSISTALCDKLGSFILYPVQIPVSIILSVLGLPVLLSIIMTMKRTI